MVGKNLHAFFLWNIFIAIATKVNSILLQSHHKFHAKVEIETLVRRSITNNIEICKWCRTGADWKRKFWPLLDVRSAFFYKYLSRDQQINTTKKSISISESFSRFNRLNCQQGIVLKRRRLPSNLSSTCYYVKSTT